MKKSFFLIFFSVLFACKVVFISGYDPVIDQTTTKIKRDFNLHFLKLARTIQDNDPGNQRFENFQDYYDNLQVDLIILADRSRTLGPKSGQVKKQIANLDSAFNAFILLHQKGLPDRSGDDRRDIRNALNSSLDAVIKLQEELKTTGEIKSDQ